MLASRLLGFTAAVLPAAILSLAAARPALAQTMINPSFEAQPVSGYSYQAIDGWSATGGGTIGGGSNGVGLDNSGGPFANNGVIPDGNQVAFLQTDGSAATTLAQTITGLTPGDQYVISFYDNSRSYGNDPILSVSFGGEAITAPQTITPVGGTNSYNFITGSSYTATGASADLIFAASIPQSGDASALIDDVTIKNITAPAAVPEASTTVSLGLLLALGLGGLAVSARRKAKTAA